MAELDSDDMGILSSMPVHIANLLSDALSGQHPVLLSRLPQLCPS